MARKGTRKSKKAKKASTKRSSKAKEKTIPILDSEEKNIELTNQLLKALEVDKPKDAKQPSAPPTLEAPMVSVEEIEALNRVKADEQPGISPEDLREERKNLKIRVPTFLPEVQMVNLLASIHDVGRLKITVPAEKVDEVLEKIWRTGFKHKLQSIHRPYRIYGPHMIDKIDVEPTT